MTRDGGDGDGDGAADAEVPCMAFGAWTAPMRLAELASAADDRNAALHPDGRLIVFASDRSGDLELYASVREKTSDPFGAPVQLVGLGSTDSDNAPSWSSDGALLHYHRLGAVNDRLVADYLGGTSFGVPRLDDVPTDGDGATFSADSLEMFYNTYPTSIDLAHATRPSIGGTWTTDAVLAGFNSAFETEGDPTFDDARQTLYFVLESPSTVFQIVQITRASRGQPFGPPSVVPNLGVGAPFAPEISKDGRTLVFTSNRPGSELADLYASTRPCQ